MTALITPDVIERMDLSRISRDWSKPIIREKLPFDVIKHIVIKSAEVLHAEELKDFLTGCTTPQQRYAILSSLTEGNLGKIIVAAKAATLSEIFSNLDMLMLANLLTSDAITTEAFESILPEWVKYDMFIRIFPLPPFAVARRVVMETSNEFAQTSAFSEFLFNLKTTTRCPVTLDLTQLLRKCTFLATTTSVEGYALDELLLQQAKRQYQRLYQILEAEKHAAADAASRASIFSQIGLFRQPKPDLTTTLTAIQILFGILEQVLERYQKLTRGETPQPIEEDITATLTELHRRCLNEERAAEALGRGFWDAALIEALPKGASTTVTPSPLTAPQAAAAAGAGGALFEMGMELVSRA